MLMLARSAIRRSPIVLAAPVELVANSGLAASNPINPINITVASNGSPNQVLLIMQQKDTGVAGSPVVAPTISPGGPFATLIGHYNSSTEGHLTLWGLVLGSSATTYTITFAASGPAFIANATIWRNVKQTVATAFVNVTTNNGTATTSNPVFITVASALKDIVVGHVQLQDNLSGFGNGTPLWGDNEWPSSGDHASYASYIVGASPSVSLTYATAFGTGSTWRSQGVNIVHAPGGGVSSGPGGADSTAAQGPLTVAEPPSTASFSGLVTGGGAAAPLLANAQAYTDQDRGLFLTYNMSTFVGTEFHDATVYGANTFAPTGMDIDQWADVAADFNCRYAVLTIKHQDGFTLWPTTTTTRGLANTTWYATHGNFDITQAYVNAFRARGVLPCFYFSIMDSYWSATHPGWTNATFKTFCEAQITEILTNYGQIAAIWLDSTYPWMGGWHPWASAEERNAFIRSVSPGIIIVDNNYREELSSSDVIEYESAVGPPGDNTDPAEHCFSITGPDAWFWKSDTHSMFDVGSIAHFIQFANSVNCTSLVGVPPNTAGVIPQSVIDRLDQVRMYLGEIPRVSPNNMTSNVLPSPYVASAQSEYTGQQAYKSFNSTIDSFWGSVSNVLPTWIQIDLGSPQTATQYMLQTRKGIVANQWLAWTLSGSNDASTWFVVDTRTQASVSPGEVRFYALSTSQTYRYWRWTITNSTTATDATHGDADIGNIALFSGAPPVIAAPTGTLAAIEAASSASFTGSMAGYDSATLAWETAVGSSNVSTGRKDLLDTLIKNLKTDGIWAKIDRLWLLAAENTASALVDLKGLVSATAVGPPSFSADDGYTGNGSSHYINTNFSPSANGVNYTTNAGCFGVWDVSTTPATGTIPIGISYFGHLSDATIRYTDSNSYWRVNSSSATLTVAYPGAGLHIANRSDSNNSQLYYNGSSITTTTGAATAALAIPFYVLARNQDSTAIGFSADQIAAVFIAGPLTATEQGNLYTRLRTYMTAVGVP